MSIENLIKELIDALKENTEEHRIITAKLKGERGGSGKDEGRNATAQEDKPAARGRGRPSGSAKDEGRNAPAPKVFSPKEVKAATQDFLNVNDPAEAENREAAIIAVLDHFECQGGVPDLDEEGQQVVYRVIEAYRAGDDWEKEIPAKRTASRRNLA